MKILIVDSHRETGELYMTLAPFFDVQVVDEFEEAKAYLDRPDGVQVDVVIVRFLLPDGKGTELAAYVKEYHPEIPVFVANEDASLDHWKEATAAGALFLPIPFDAAKVKQVCGRNKKKPPIETPDQNRQQLQPKAVPQETAVKSVSKEEKGTPSPLPDAEQEVPSASKREEEIEVPSPTKTVSIAPEPKKRVKKLRQKIYNEHYCTVITVFSPKGGVGKTTTTVNLASLLKTELDIRTAILEFSRQTGNVLGHFPLNPTMDVGNWLELSKPPKETEIEDMLLWCPNTEVAVLPTRKLLDDDQEKVKIKPEEATDIIQTLHPHFDCIVIDGGTILDDVLFKLLEVSDHVLMISKMERETLQDCHYMPLMMERRGIDTEKLMNVLNQAKKGLGLSISDAKDMVGVQNSHVIHFDPGVEKVAKEKEPYIIRTKSKSKYFKEIWDLASKLIDHPEFEDQPSLFQKLKFWG